MDPATNPVLKAFLAGSLSGTASTILFQPLDLVKTRLQNQESGPRTRVSMVGVVSHVLRTEHVQGLWKGLWPSVARTVPGVGIYFGSLHWLKSHALGPNAQPTPVQAIALGMTARSLSGAIMIPITVIKTRYESGTYRYTRMSQALVQIYAEEGVRGLSRGLMPTLFRDAPFSGIYLMFYTQLKQLAKASRSDKSSSASTHFACGVVAGLLASVLTHPADVVKTYMQLHPAQNPTVRLALENIANVHGARGFLAGIVPRMMRRTLMSAMAWTVYEEMMKRVGLK